MSEKAHTILIIEDEEAIRMSMTNYLEDRDYHVLVAENGKSGIDLFDRKQPDIILTDLRMPITDGLEVIEYIQEKSNNIPIIVISGKGKVSDAIDAIRLGAWDYLLKPIEDLSILVHRIEIALEKTELIKKNIEYKENLEQLVEKRALELKQTNSRLFESEKRFRTLYENMPCGMMLVGMDYVIKDVNDITCSITGYTKDELIGQFCDILCPKGSESKQCLILEVGQEYFEQMDTTIKCKDGKKHPILKNARKIMLEGKEYILENFIDLEEQKKAEEVQRIAREEAEKANELKSQFLANISHELRTPLNSIIGYSQLMSKYDFKKSEIQDNLKRIFSSGKYLLSLVNDLLDVSKIETGKEEIEYSEFSLSQLINEVISIFSTEQANDEVILSADINSEIKDIINTDYKKLKQILVNLTGNSVKFTEKGSIKIKVELEKENSKKLKFSICDTGIGISEKTGNKIFNLFVQADGSLTRKHGGTGLGLSISKRYVEMLDGKIWFDSVENQGTTFYFTIKINYFTDNIKKEIQKTGEIDKKVGDTTSIQEVVLLIDDDKEFKLIINPLLKRLNMKLEIAFDGETGISMSSKISPDLVLMDIQMPVLNGIDTMKIMKQDDNLKHVPIIAVTAHNMAGDRDYFLNCGFDDYISKPINLDELEHKLLQYLGKTVNKENNLL